MSFTRPSCRTLLLGNVSTQRGLRWFSISFLPRNVVRRLFYPRGLLTLGLTGPLLRKAFVCLPHFDALVDPLIWNLDGLSWLEVEKGLERFSLLASLVGLFDGRLGRLKSS